MAGMAGDEDLEVQARAMAEKTLPSSLPAAARAAKLPTLTQKILERLRKQRDEQSMQNKEKATTVATGPIAAAAPVPPSSSTVHARDPSHGGSRAVWRRVVV